MVPLIGSLIAIGEIVAWFSAVVHAVLLLGHRKDEYSLLALAFQGHRFFSRDTWKDSGHHLHKRFIVSSAVFFGLGLLGMSLLKEKIAPATARPPAK